MLRVCRRLGVPVELRKKGDLPVGWNGWHRLNNDLPFAVQYGEFIDTKTFVPGRVVALDAPLRDWSSACYGGGYRLEAVFLHEVAHAILGPNETLCTVWERDACRLLFSHRAYQNTCAYSGCTRDEIRAMRMLYSFRPGWSLKMRPQQPPQEQPC